MVAHTAVVLLLFVGVTAAQMPTFRVCPDIPKPKVPSVPLPELAQQFEVRIQANIINVNITEKWKVLLVLHTIVIVLYF